MVKLIDLYLANNNWGTDTKIILTGSIDHEVMSAERAARIYGDRDVAWFNIDTVYLI